MKQCKFMPFDVVEHIKDGVYRIIAAGELERTGEHCYVYQGIDGQIWIRPCIEIDYGEFKLLRKEGQKIYLNKQFISSFTANSDGGTVISMSNPQDGEFFCVTDTPEQIWDMVNKQELKTIKDNPVAWRYFEKGVWWNWRCDWDHHDRAIELGCPVQYAYHIPEDVK